MTNNKNRDVQTIGRVLSDGTLIEMIYTPATESGLLAVKRPGKSVELTQSVEDVSRKTTYTPQIDMSIRKGLVLLPSSIVSPIAPSALFSRVQSFINEFVEMEEDCVSIAAAYAITSYLYDKFEKIPYLRFFGPHASGKSRALTILRSICFHSVNLGVSQTAPNLFRTLNHLGSATLFLDEANFQDTSKTSDMTKILNDGYSREGSVYRCDPKTFETVPYALFSPKVIANHTSYDDPALESRMFSIDMRPSKRKDVPKGLPPMDIFQEAIEIRNLLLAHRLEYFDVIDTEQRYDALEEFDPRAQEITYPLLWSQNLKTSPEYLLDYLRRSQTSLRERKMFDEDAIVAEVVFNLRDQRKSSVTLLEVRNLVLEKGQIDVSYKRLGHHLRQFGASSFRASQGYVFNPQTINVEYLKNRYGL